MTKTPDEIKLGVASCLGCDNERPLCQCCPYKSKVDKPHCGDLLREDALALIQQLQADNAEQAERIKQLEAELDAAVADLKRGGNCFACKNWKTEVCFACQYGRTRRFEWRGVQKEE